MKASVCIPFHDQARLVGPVLGALARQRLGRHEMEVVASPGRPGDRVHETALLWSDSPPLVVLPESERPLFRSENRNRCAGAASGEVLIFIDGDIIASRELVKAHCDFHERTRGAVGSGWVRMACDVDRLNAHMARRIAEPRDGATIEGRTLTAQNFSMRRGDFVRIGGFDESFSAYGGEDADLGLRAEAAGLRVVHVAAARARHLQHYSLERLAAAHEEYGRRSLLVLARKHPRFAGRFTGLVDGSLLRRSACPLVILKLLLSASLALSHTGYGPAVEFAIRAARLKGAASSDHPLT